MTGFSIGERKFSFKGKMHVLDKKNRLFGEIAFEDCKKGFFSKKKWKSDFM